VTGTLFNIYSKMNSSTNITRQTLQSIPSAAASTLRRSITHTRAFCVKEF